jgi:hypothetical protein
MSLFPLAVLESMHRGDLALNIGFDCNEVGPKIDLNKSR